MPVETRVPDERIVDRLRAIYKALKEVRGDLKEHIAFTLAYSLVVHLENPKVKIRVVDTEKGRDERFTPGQLAVYAIVSAEGIKHEELSPQPVRRFLARFSQNGLVPRG